MNVRVPIIIDVMIDGSRNALAVALACACAGIVIGIVALTGAGIVFTQAVIGLSQNYLLLALILTGVAGIVLGMGMPTTPAYIVMTSLLVPALIKLGVMMPAAQMFAFYFAILSAITPPVALAVYAAAGLAKADLWTSGWAAVKIGATGFIVPFMFVYEPALLMIGDWPTIIWRFVCSCLGIGLVAAGLHGYLLRRCASWERVLLVDAAFCLVKPDWLTDLLGLGLAAAMFAFQWPQRDRPLPTRSVGPVTAGAVQPDVVKSACAPGRARPRGPRHRSDRSIKFRGLGTQRRVNIHHEALIHQMLNPIRQHFIDLCAAAGIWTPPAGRPLWDAYETDWQI